VILNKQNVGSSGVIGVHYTAQGGVLNVSTSRCTKQVVDTHVYTIHSKAARL
jgi:hypothetical protein